MPFTLRVTVNLMKLATSIGAKGGDKRISGALRRAWRAQSCSADLEQAQGAYDALAQLTENSGSIERESELQRRVEVTAPLAEPGPDAREDRREDFDGDDDQEGQHGRDLQGDPHHGIALH